MREARRAFIAFVLAGACSLPLMAQQVRVTASAEADFAVADVRVVDLKAAGHDQVLVVGRSGEVRTWNPSDTSDGKHPFDGTARLTNPRQSLVDVVPLSTGEDVVPSVLVLGRGLELHAVKDGSVSESALKVWTRGGFPYRTDVPRFCEFARDLNGDGLVDLIVPERWRCQVWLQEAPGESAKLPRFRKVATFPLDLEREELLKAGTLSDELHSALRIPKLAVSDLNADGRDDLHVEDSDVHRFFMQRPDGSLPERATVTLDLDTFRDVTPEAGIRLGEAVQGERKARLAMRDLDGDDRPDFVISHLRKLWVYRGDENGPQFERHTQILRVAEDITRAELAHLDEDRHPDLVLIRVIVPTVADMLQGLFAEWDVSIVLLDYPGLGREGFAKSVRRRREVTLRVPPITNLISNADEYLTRFEDAAQQVRASVSGDFDGDGKVDLAVVTKEGDALEFWLGVGESEKPASDLEGLLRQVVLSPDEAVYDIDRIFGLIADLSSQSAYGSTGGRPADCRLELRSAEEFRDPELHVLDRNGDGRQELCLTYERLGTRGEVAFDLVEVSASGSRRGSSARR